MLRKKRTYALILLLLFISYGIHYLLNSDNESNTLARTNETIISSTSAEIRSSQLIYIIKQNDTWKSLADSFKLCASEICLLNSLKPDRQPKEGDTIEIPLHLSTDSTLNPEHYSEITYSLDENGFCKAHRLPAKTTKPTNLSEENNNDRKGTTLENLVLKQHLKTNILEEQEMLKSQAIQMLKKKRKKTSL